MLPMHRDPLLPLHAGAEPERHPEDPVEERMYVESPVGERAVQIHGGGEHRRLGDDDRGDHD
jgi:hypothetical protein